MTFCFALAMMNVHITLVSERRHSQRSAETSGNNQGACAAVCARVKGRENWGGRGWCSYLDSLTVAGPADAAAASVRRAPPAALRPSLASIVRERKFRERRTYL